MNYLVDLKYKIALSLISGIGFASVKSLIAYVGSVEGVFSEKEQNLKKIPGIGEVTAHRLITQNVIAIAEKEIEFIQKYDIRCLFYLDSDYPRRLLNCSDAPVVLYVKGKVDLNTQRILSLVGTRSATSYGKEICHTFICDLASRPYPVLVISGLAYGIDVNVHKACLKYDIPTIGVLGHGLDRIYPSLHQNIARKMLERGALVTDFVSGTAIDRHNFLQRNRIIAGMADAVLIIESAEKGGALVTADIANSYNRDVFAFPGRNTDNYSRGCNKLIKNNEAVLIENVEDLEKTMGWELKQEKPSTIQKQLFVELSESEQKIVDSLKDGPKMIDEICQRCVLPASKALALLLELEFKGLVENLPGKMYRLR